MKTTELTAFREGHNLFLFNNYKLSQDLPVNFGV